MVNIKKNHFKSYFLVAWKELAVVAGVLFLDLLTKFLIDKSMNLGEKKVLIKNFFNFYYCLNYEAAMGFDFWLGDRLGASGLRILFIAFVSVATIVFAFFLVRGHKESFLFRLPLALIIGGALGNLYDRIVHHSVRDFIHFEYFGKTLFGSTYFPTFNLADSALVIGVTLFMIYFIFFDAKIQKKKEAAKVAEKEAALLAENAENAEKAAAKASESGKLEDKPDTKIKAKATDNDVVFEDNATLKEEKTAKPNEAKAEAKAEEKDASKKNNATLDAIENKPIEVVSEDALPVEILGNRKNYTRKVVTETVVTETIITETKTKEKQKPPQKKD